MSRFFDPVIQALDNAGVALEGAKLNFYENGTTTRKDTFSDPSMTTANANPVIADAAGRFGNIYLAEGFYTVSLTTVNDANLWGRDNVSAAASSATTSLVVATISDMTALSSTALSDNKSITVLGYNSIGDGGGGAFYWDASSTETTNLGTIIALDGGGTGRFKRIYSEPVDIKWFGATGDGSTNDTAAIQSALDTEKLVFFSEPEVSYKVTTLNPIDDQKIYGPGRDVVCLVGDDTSDTIVCGDGTGTIRNIGIFGLTVSNNNARSIYVNVSPDLHIENCSLSSTGDDCLELFQSERSTVKGSRILCSGAFNAFKALDNCNALLFSGNIVTGGELGRAVLVGQSQGVGIKNNTIEASLDGIWIASSSLTGDGNCNGVDISNNYIEQCSTPFVVAQEFSAFGVKIQNNFVSNGSQTVISTRVSTVSHGRMNGAQITDNAFYVSGDGSEDLLHIYLPVATGDVENVEFARNYVSGTVSNTYQLFGAFSTNNEVLNGLGANNRYDFALGNFIGKRYFVSPTITANVGLASTEWLSLGDAEFGGEIDAVEIINASGTLTGCDVAFGSSVDFQENVASVDASTITLTNGRGSLTVVLSGVDRRVGGYNRFIASAGSGTGTFRLRVTYRAN